MSVDELIQTLQKISSEGKGSYSVTCEGYCVDVSADDIEISDHRKEISL